MAPRLAESPKTTGRSANVSSNPSTGTAIALAQPRLRSARSSRCPHPTGRRKKMIWKSIVRPRAAATTYARWSAFARNTVGTVSDFAGVVRNLALDIRDSYRPELHYMRGPGPKWRAKQRPIVLMALAEQKPDQRIDGRETQATSAISDPHGACVYSNRSIATAIALGQSQEKFGIIKMT